MTTRISNLGVSGLDIDETVKNLMKARRASYDKLFQKKTLAEWKKASYNTMYTAINSFRNTVYTNKLQSTLLPKTASSSNETVATASANSDAAVVSHDLIVSALATGVKKTSSAAITTGTSKSTLADQFGINGSFNIQLTNGTATKTIAVSSTQSIYDLVSAINNSGTDLSANYDATLDRFFIATKGTGASSGISFSGSDQAGLDFLANNLKISTADGSGTDAAFTLDGASLTQNSNTFTISGVSYTLKSVGGTVDNPVRVGIAADVDKAVTNIKAFVDSYNSMLEKVNAALAEDKYRDYAPLTDEQRADMTEAQAKQWDEKAKSGLLRHDSILQSMVSSLRSSLSVPVSGISGTYSSAASLGITTGAYTEGGKLYLDESKLRAALVADPEAANKVFGTAGTDSAGQGVAVRMYDALKGTLGRIKTEAGLSAGVSDDSTSSLAVTINRYTKDMTSMNTRLKEIEDRYYKQFDAMEVALSKLASQSSWLSQQFSSSSSSG